MNLLSKLLILAVLLTAIAVGTLFSVQNTAQVPLDMLVYNFEARSIAVWVLCAFGLGSVLGMLTSTAMVLRLRNAVRVANRKIEKTSAELDKLRAPDRQDGE